MKQALENADWLVAMQQEYDALLKNKTNKEVEDRKRSEKTQQYNFYCK